MGLGTWIIRQAAPNARLILLDPNKNLQLAYKVDLFYSLKNNSYKLTHQTFNLDNLIQFNSA